MQRRPQAQHAPRTAVWYSPFFSPQSLATVLRFIPAQPSPFVNRLHATRWWQIHLAVSRTVNILTKLDDSRVWENCARGGLLHFDSSAERPRPCESSLPAAVSFRCP